MMDLTGQNLSQYRILEQIGAGGMATVYKAYQPSLERHVAIKVLPPYFMHVPGFAERFEREAKAIAQLVHPNILPIYDFGREGDLSYIVMRFVDAGTLKHRMVQPLHLDEIARITDDLASALNYAHEHRVIHRDIKPGNVLIDERGWVLLSDFGLAKMAEGSNALTGSGVGVGTPAYMSPEQGQGLKVDHRTDIYSLGVMLYEMMVGRVPYDAETPFAIVLQHISSPLPLPRKVNPNISEELEQVILKAMAKSPDDRFKSAGDLAAALRKAVTATAGDAARTVLAPAAYVPEPEIPSETAVVRPPSPTIVERAAPAAARRLPWPLIAGAAGALVVALVIGAVALRVIRQRGAEATPPIARVTEAADLPTRALAPTQVPAPTQAPVPSQPASQKPTEDAILRELLTPPSQGLFVSTCPDNATQLCVNNIGQSKPLNRIPVNKEIDGYLSWSPTGDRILFSTKEGKSHNLWTVARDGSDPRQVAFEPNINEMNGAWSPNGEWIAFHRDGRLYLIHPDSQGLTEVPFPAELRQRCMPIPAWSPDGQQLAFLLDNNACVDPDGRKTIKVGLVAMNWDGTNARHLVEWETKSDHAMHVAWSPDGRFITYQPEPNQSWFLVSSDGSGEPFPIGKYPAWWLPNFLPAGSQPQPSSLEAGPPPEGTHLQECGGDRGVICLSLPNGQTKSILINKDLWFRGPSWSPDGNHIVVSAGKQGDPYGEKTPWSPGDLYILDTACLSQPQTCRDTLRPITSGEEDNDIHPAWSPDGEWIAFHRNGDLTIIRPDGSDVTPFNFNMGERCVLEPAWAPDSRQIVFLSVVGGCGNEPPFDLEVSIIGIDGGGDRTIWRDQADDFPWGVAWSPDGQAVAASAPFEGQMQWLLISLADGSVQSMSGEPTSWLPEHWPPWDRQAQPPQASASESPQDPWGVIVIPEGSPISIGLGADFAEPATTIAQDVRDAAQLAVDEAGQLHGHPIQLVVADSACNPDGGTEAAQELAAIPEMAGVIGHVCSIASLPAAAVYQETHIVMISPSSTAINLTQQGIEIVNRTAFPPPLEGARAAGYLREALGIERAAIVSPEDENLQAAEGFHNRFTSINGEVPYFQTLAPDTQDFTPILAEIQSVNVQAIFYPGTSGNFVRQAREILGDLPLVLSQNGLTFANQFRESAGDALEGTFAVAPGFDSNSPTARPFLQAFTSRYGHRPAIFAGTAYDATNVLLAAIEQVAVVGEGGQLYIGRQALATSVRNTRGFPGVSGPITFDPNGDRVDEDLGVFIFRDGEWTRAP